MYLVWEGKGSGKSKVYAILCFLLLLWQKKDSVADDSTTKKVNGSQRRGENGTSPSLLEMITVAVGHDRPPLQHPCALIPSVWNCHNIIIFIEQDTFFNFQVKAVINIPIYYVCYMNISLGVTLLFSAHPTQLYMAALYAKTVIKNTHIHWLTLKQCKSFLTLLSYFCHGETLCSILDMLDLLSLSCPDNRVTNCQLQLEKGNNHF